MAGWIPRSQREGIADYDGPYEGLPDHLVGPLKSWLADAFHHGGSTTMPWRTAEMRVLALRLRMTVDAESKDHYLFREIWYQCLGDSDLSFDVIEGALQVGQGDAAVQRLRNLLGVGGSVLTVSPDGKLLTEVVAPEASSLAASAMATSDQTSVELIQAWGHAYGRLPDPSDAWDHAIKAVESILQPVVCPNDSKATLGKIIGNLNSEPGWRTIFPGVNQDGDVTNLVAALRLVWPNLDRHGPVVRQPTLQEARAVVNLAVALVQCHRDGGLVLKVSSS